LIYKVSLASPHRQFAVISSLFLRTPFDEFAFSLVMISARRSACINSSRESETRSFVSDGILVDSGIVTSTSLVITKMADPSHSSGVNEAVLGVSNLYLSPAANDWFIDGLRRDNKFALTGFRKITSSSANAGDDHR
jgi:hypothetical protein